MRNKLDEAIKKQDNIRNKPDKMRTTAYEEIRIKPDRVRFSPDTIFSHETKSSPESRYNSKIRNSPDETRINTFQAHNNSETKHSTTITTTSLNESL